MDRQSSPVKIMFQILQYLHHLVMLQDNANTAGPRQAFFQKAKELDRLWDPPATPDLADKIKSINLAWAFEIRSTLVTHYRTQLDFLSGSLKAWNLSATDCAQAKLKAKEWAKRNFGRKLKPQTLSEFDRTFFKQTHNRDAQMNISQNFWNWVSNIMILNSTTKPFYKSQVLQWARNSHSVMQICSWHNGKIQPWNNAIKNQQCTLDIWTIYGFCGTMVKPSSKPSLTS